MKNEIISLEELRDDNEMAKYGMEPEVLAWVRDSMEGLYRKKAELEADLSIAVIVRCGWALTYQDPKTTEFSDLKVYNHRQKAYVPIILDIPGIVLFEDIDADKNIKKGAAGGRIHVRSITKGHLAETIKGLQAFTFGLKNRLA